MATELNIDFFKKMAEQVADAMSVPRWVMNDAGILIRAHEGEYIVNTTSSREADHESAIDFEEYARHRLYELLMNIESTPGTPIRRTEDAEVISVETIPNEKTKALLDDRRLP